MARGVDAESCRVIARTCTRRTGRGGRARDRGTGRAGRSPSLCRGTFYPLQPPQQVPLTFFGYLFLPFQPLPESLAFPSEKAKKGK